MTHRTTYYRRTSTSMDDGMPLPIVERHEQEMASAHEQVLGGVSLYTNLGFATTKARSGLTAMLLDMECGKVGELVARISNALAELLGVFRRLGVKVHTMNTFR